MWSLPIFALMRVIQAFVFLGALELSLRHIKSRWLALFLGSALAYLVNVFLFVHILMPQQSGAWWEFSRTHRWSLSLYPATFSTVYWWGLWLLKNRDEITRGSDI